MIVWLYRAFGAFVVGATIFVVTTGYTTTGSRDKLPDTVKNSPGAYRSYFILYGGK